MKRVVTAWEAVERITLAYLPIMVANCSFIGVCNQEPFRLPQLQDQKLVTLHWRSFSRWCRERVSFSLPIKDANASIMCIHYHVAFLLPDLQDQKLLTLRWRSFWRWGRERVTFCFAYRGCQYIEYVYSLPSRIFITRHIGPKIVDALLTVIFKMGQGACFLLCCL